jgi:hypothetical protein
VNLSANANSSTINLNGSTMTFAGTGSLRISKVGAPEAVIGGAGTLVNSGSHTIKGAGLLGNNSISIRNLAGATIDANVEGQTLRVDPGAGAWTNAGTMRASDGGILELIGTGGGSQLGNTGGLITAVGEPSQVILNSLTINGGSLDGSGGGTITLSTSSTSTIQNLSVSGLLAVPPTTQLQSSGAVTLGGLENLSTIELTGVAGNNATFRVTDGTLTNNGSIDLRGAGNAVLAGESNATLVNNGTISGAGHIQAITSTPFNLVNNGTINASIKLNIDAIAGGTLALVNNGRIEVGINQSATVLGRVAIDNSNGRIVVNSGATFVNNNVGVITSGGLVNTLGTFLDSSSLGMSVGSITGSGTFTKSDVNPAATSSFNFARVSNIQIDDGTIRTNPNGGPGGTSRVSNLFITIGEKHSSKWDLTNNDLVYDYISSSPLDLVRDLIGQGFNNGNWQGLGLTSSSAASSPNAGEAGRTGLGYGEASVLGLTTFSGQDIDATTVVVKYTYAGDANLDGQVDVADLGALASNWQTSAVWTGGDFDYNGSVDVNDLGLLATNWQAGVGGPLGPSLAAAAAGLGLPVSAVPEPLTSGVLMVLGSAGLGLRRRRR